jgi:hypothetical protein
VRVVRRLPPGDDAQKILVMLAEKRDERFSRAAARFAARLTLERRLGPSEAHRVPVPWATTDQGRLRRSPAF